MYYKKKLTKHGNSIGVNIDSIIKNSLNLKPGDEVLFKIKKIKGKK